MLKILEFLKINRIFIIMIILSSCNRDKSTLSGVSSIKNKKIIIDDKNINTTSVYKFKNNDYPLERDLYFDNSGKITKVGESKGEGILYYYKNPSEIQLGLNKEYLNFKLKLDTVNHFIIENKDTIKSFNVNHIEKIIYFKHKKTNRTSIYNFE